MIFQFVQVIPYLGVSMQKVALIALVCHLLLIERRKRVEILMQHYLFNVTKQFWHVVALPSPNLIVGCLDKISQQAQTANKIRLDRLCNQAQQHAIQLQCVGQAPRTCCRAQQA